MMKNSKPENRFVGEGYSFCVANGTIYHLNEDGSYDESNPRIKVREAVGFLKKQFVPATRTVRAVALLKDKRDVFDKETQGLFNDIDNKIMKLQSEVLTLRQEREAIRAKRQSKRDSLLRDIGHAVDAQSKAMSFCDSKGNRKIRFNHDMSCVCVGCNEVPMAQAKKLAARLAKMLK